MRSDVCITVFNPTDRAVECMDSLLANREEVDRIIVLDNASEHMDNVTEVAKRADVVVRCNVQVSLGALWNIGIAISRTPTMVLSNDDIVFCPGWLQPLHRAIKADPNLGVVQPYNTLGGIPEDFPENYERIDRVGAIPLTNFIGCCFLLRKDILEQIKAFDRTHWEDSDDFTYFCEAFYPFGPEDQDFYRRVREAGLHTHTAFGSYVHHYSGETMKQFTDYETVKAQGEALYVQRWGSGRV